MTVATLTTAEANRAYVRDLLIRRQPGFAAVLEKAARCVEEDLFLHGTGWLHSLHRAEVEAAGQRLDEAFALSAATGGGEQ